MEKIDISLEALDLIKTLARKASPGPWMEVVPPEGDIDDDCTFITSTARHINCKVEIAKLEHADPYDESPDAFTLEQRANAAFIEAMNPAIALAICELIEWQRAEIERLQKIIMRM